MSFVESALKKSSDDAHPIRYFTKYSHRKKGILKPNQILHAKCSKTLKKKLKKYKLRNNGEEDPDILNVSQCLRQVLKLRSPNKAVRSLPFKENIEFNSIERPKNYLFKMGRRKINNESKNKDPPLTAHDNKANYITSPEIEKVKKKTNAFQFMMESRNKSLGTNSPGKDKDQNNEDTEEVFEKKKASVKRKLALQKLAESKGLLKRQEKEEYIEECIKKKMEKRAANLKDMITKGAKVKPSQLNTITSKNLVSDAKKELSSNKELNNQNQEQIMSTSHKSNSKLSSPPNKKVTKEDAEFLSKLSPSIKKKESMLCYVKKIEKEKDLVNISDDDNQSKENESIIKVKLASMKNKRKVKKRKLSLNKNNAIEESDKDNKKVVEKELDIVNEPVDNFVDKLSKINNETPKPRKRKRSRDQKPETNMSTENQESRPRRSIRKPVKYTDDILSSSEDELLIFSKKKKKHETKQPKAEVEENIIDLDNLNTNKTKKSKDGNVKERLKLQNKRESIPKVPNKLAPIFGGKSQIDNSAFEARQKFLHSGMPEQLKKSKSLQVVNEYVNSFHTVVHVRQSDLKITTPTKLDKLFIEADNLLVNQEYEPISIRKLLCIDDVLENQRNCLAKNDIKETLKSIKDSYPEFPVYRTYKVLYNKRKGVNQDINCQNLNNSSEILNSFTFVRNSDPNNLCWTERYKATSSKQIIGNFESVKELKRWLESWSECEKSRQIANDDSDSDFYNSDQDSRDSMKMSNNLLVLHGPVGSGKTSSVYAVATELSIKVIEVNASSRRSGKILLQDLHEATQSHKVNRSKGSSVENSQNSQEIFKKILTKKGKVGRKKKVVSSTESQSYGSQEENNKKTTAMSLILIDDADIVFEQDDGFTSAIAQLIQYSKRPVILITNLLTSLSIQKLLLTGQIIKMNPLSPRILGTWLDILCLADSGFCVPGIGQKVLDNCNGDIRKSINLLQFYISSEVNNQIEEDTNDNLDIDNDEDENSNYSWICRDLVDNKCKLESNEACSDMWEQIVNKDMNNLDLYSTWQSIPNIFACYDNDQKTNVEDLNALSTVMDSISQVDTVISNVHSKERSYICCYPWQSVLYDSVSERENNIMFNKFDDVTKDICKELLNVSINKAQAVLGNNKSKTIGTISQSDSRYREKTLARHDFFTNSVSASSTLDRRALALDYWSTCRTICRIEKTKTDTNCKRNNRFCHYLKSVNVMCKNEVFDKLCLSLKPEEDFS